MHSRETLSRMALQQILMKILDVFITFIIKIMEYISAIFLVCGLSLFEIMFNTRRMRKKFQISGLKTLLIYIKLFHNIHEVIYTLLNFFRTFICAIVFATLIISIEVPATFLKFTANSETSKMYSVLRKYINNFSSELIIIILPLDNLHSNDFSLLNVRIHSFSSCEHLTLGRILFLAKLGFYFIGGTNCKCYGCAFKVSLTVLEERRSVRDIHHQDCPHQHQIQPEDVREHLLSNRFNYWLHESSHSQTTGEVDLGYRRRRFASEERLSEYIHRREEIGFFTLTPPKYPNFVLLQNRERSFLHCSINLQSIRNDLAKAGFFYVGGKIVCFCCGIEFQDWQIEHEPFERHLLYSPRCRHIRQSNTRRNTTDVQNFSESQNFSSLQTITIQENSFVCNDDHATHSEEGGNNNEHRQGDAGSFMTRTGRPATAEENETSPPRNPQYSTYQQRMSSFRNCQISQETKEDHAKAGFFYDEVEGNVRCFHCDGGFREFPLKNPITDHNRFFPGCPFLQNAASQPSNVLPSTEKADILQDGKNGFSEMGPLTNPTTYNTSFFSQCLSLQNTSSSPSNVLPSAEEVHIIHEGKNLQTLNDQSEKDSYKGNVENASSAFCKEHYGDHKYTSAKLEKKSCGTSIQDDVKPVSLSRNSGRNTSLEELLQENVQLKIKINCLKCSCKQRTVVFLPCSHLCVCFECRVSLTKCLICNKLIKGTINIKEE